LLRELCYETWIDGAFLAGGARARTPDRVVGGCTDVSSPYAGDRTG
jgi:hypothetical protein